MNAHFKSINECGNAAEIIDDSEGKLLAKESRWVVIIVRRNHTALFMLKTSTILVWTSPKYKWVISIEKSWVSFWTKPQLIFGLVESPWKRISIITSCWKEKYYFERHCSSSFTFRSNFLVNRYIKKIWKFMCENNLETCVRIWIKHNYSFFHNWGQVATICLFAAKRIQKY